MQTSWSGRAAIRLVVYSGDFEKSEKPLKDEVHHEFF
jgi:hypothetical protein